MVLVVIFLCAVLIGFNIIYNTDETQEKNDTIESEVQKKVKKL